MNKIPIEIINDTINLDDTVNTIKKIFYYLSNEKYLLIECNQELWIEIHKKKYTLGYYYNNYDYEPSINSKVIVDHKNFVNNIGLSKINLN